MAGPGRGAPAQEDSRTAREAADPADSPKRHGDKLAGSAGAALEAEASAEPSPGDSPKRQGDKLDHAVREAAKG